jgi:hypothetical protein
LFTGTNVQILTPVGAAKKLARDEVPLLQQQQKRLLPDALLAPAKPPATRPVQATRIPVQGLAEMLQRRKEERAVQSRTLVNSTAFQRLAVTAESRESCAEPHAR